MGHKFEVKNKHKLDNDERRRILPPGEILAQMGLRQGDIMADIGCGIGYFTFPAAQIVGPGGEVFAMDILPEMLTEVENKISESAITNISIILTGENDLKLADKSVNFAFICNVLHETEDTVSFLNEVKRITSDHGQIAIIEWKKAETEIGPPLAHRLAREYVEELLQQAAFKEVQSIDLGEQFYAVLGHKK